MIAGPAGRVPLLPQPGRRPAARPGRAGGDDVFAEARQLPTWHYQWIIVHEFLPQIIGHAAGQRHPAQRAAVLPAAAGRAFIPVEFQGAALPLRAQHGAAVVPRQPGAATTASRSSAFIFDPAGEGQAIRSTCAAARARRGASSAGRRSSTSATAQRAAEQADRHQDLDAAVQPAARRHRQRRPADLAAAAQPAAAPDLVAAVGPGHRAARCACPLLTAGTSPSWRSSASASMRSTPLWYYILKEAELIGDGLQLGPVGGRIVGEVFIGLLQLDPNSYLSSAAELAADAAERATARRLPDGRLPDLRRGRSGQSRPVVSAVTSGS